MENDKYRDQGQHESRDLKPRDSQALSTDIYRDYELPVEEELELRDYIDVILRRKWIVLSCLVISVVTAGIASLIMDPVYKATASIEIAPENPKITTFQEVVTVEAQQREFYETQFKLIKSKSLAKNVIETLDLDSHPEFAKKDEDNPALFDISSTIGGLFSLITTNTNSEKPTLDHRQKNLAEEQRLVSSFLDRVEIEPDRKSRLVEVSFESTDSELAAKATNTLVDEYIEWIMDRKIAATKNAREFLEKQLTQAKANLERSEEELNKFAQNKDIVSLDENLNLILKQLSEINEAYSKAEAERLAKESLYEEVKAGNYSFLPQVMNDPSIAVLSEEYTKLKSKYDNLSVTYGPNYPKMKQLSAQLARIKNEINSRVEAIAQSIKKDYEAAARKERMLKKRAQEQEERVAKLNEQTVQYRILQREVETNKSIYENLLQRLKETEVTSAIKATNIQVVDSASIPLSPYKPNTKLNLALATIMGLMGGVFLAFGFEHFDTTIKDEEEFKKRFSLPLLGVVPLHGDGKDKEGIDRIVHEDPGSMVSESFRIIRTSIMYSSPDHPPRSFLITSSQPLEGKTISASNLALSMIQAGNRVVLIDADLRKPRLHKIFLDNGNTFGLSTFLIGKIHLPGVINQTEVKDLYVIPSGPIPPNPAELLGSKRMREMLEILLKTYDYVVMDAAPITGFADSRLLSMFADGVLLVTSLGMTQRQALQNSIEEILKVRGRILGTILNRYEPRGSKYGYKYYYYYSDEANKKIRKITAPRS